MSEQERDELLAAIARSIISRQGNPNRTQAEFVLAVIDEQGWTLTRKDTK
jgi:hypothetical protein